MLWFICCIFHFDNHFLPSFPPSFNSSFIYYFLRSILPSFGPSFLMFPLFFLPSFTPSSLRVFITLFASLLTPLLPVLWRLFSQPEPVQLRRELCVKQCGSPAPGRPASVSHRLAAIPGRRGDRHRPGQPGVPELPAVRGRPGIHGPGTLHLFPVNPLLYFCCCGLQGSPVLADAQEEEW